MPKKRRQKVCLTKIIRICLLLSQKLLIKYRTSSVNGSLSQKVSAHSATEKNVALGFLLFWSLNFKVWKLLEPNFTFPGIFKTLNWKHLWIATTTKMSSYSRNAVVRRQGANYEDDEESDLERCAKQLVTLVNRYNSGECFSKLKTISKSFAFFHHSLQPRQVSKGYRRTSHETLQKYVQC